MHETISLPAILSTWEIIQNNETLQQVKSLLYKMSLVWKDGCDGR
jgi:hypothetical protein